jgi:hypothetical protein
LRRRPSQYSGFVYTPHTAPSNCVTDAATPTDASSLCARDQYTPFQVQRDFFTHALNDTDQLRQRVAYALSHIFVVSSVEIYEAYGLAAYQNMLLNDAFGNYRTLLQDVTLSPVMGHYLDMVDNAKPDPANGTTPNENYAREVLQLFSIGLFELNPTVRSSWTAAVHRSPRTPRMRSKASHPCLPAGLIRRCPVRPPSGPTRSTSTASWWLLTTSMMIPIRSHCSTATPYPRISRPRRI